MNKATFTTYREPQHPVPVPGNRDWYDEETDFKEKSVGYTELGYD